MKKTIDVHAAPEMDDSVKMTETQKKVSRVARENEKHRWKHKVKLFFFRFLKKSIFEGTFDIWTGSDIY